MPIRKRQDCFHRFSAFALSNWLPLCMYRCNKGSVQVREGVDLVAPALDVVPDAESGKEIERLRF
jgi:hypothetical protein